MTAFSSNVQTTDQTVLIVAASPSADLLAFGEQLASTGASVHFTTDVYSAMARLALGEPFSHVVVDAATLDGYDEAFLSLAPQYFRDVAFHVPQDHSTSNRMLPNGRFEPGAAPEIFDRIVGIREAEVAEAAEADGPFVGVNEQHAIEDTTDYAQQNVVATTTSADASDPSNHQDHSQDRPADGVHEDVTRHDSPQGDPLAPMLSTDGGTDHHDDAPSLHDSVRRRMGGDNQTPQRRRPPGNGESPPDDARLSAEEMDALLGRTATPQNDDDAQDEPTRGESGS